CSRAPSSYSFGYDYC
nr:immunoglobulin heavy chain junction region [Macaca mulatta]